MPERRIAREVPQKNLAGSFVLCSNHVESQQKAAEGVFLVIGFLDCPCSFLPVYHFA